MGENPIKVTGIQKQPQQFSTTGIKLSTLKEQNELLFNYFKTNGYKEDAIIYSSDVDKITKSADTNDNEKLSIKEAREMGLEGSRKEIRSALNQLKEIKNSELAPNVSGNYPVVINENETEFYNKDGVLLSNTKNFENGGKLETFYLKGDKNKVDKTLETSANGKDVTETIYKDGNIEQPEQQTIKQDNDTTVVKYDWFEDKLNSKTTSKGNDVETVIYKQIKGEAVPERIVSSFKSDPNSVKSIVNKFNDDYKIDAQTIEYSGAKIGEGLIKEDIDIAPDTGNKVAEEATFSDGTKQYYQTINGKLEQVGKDKDGNHFVVLDVPEGWGMDKIADEFGITKEDLLKANTDKDGNKLYHTNPKGIEYFYINDKAIIPKPNKIPQDNKYAISYELPKQDGNQQKGVVESSTLAQSSSAPTHHPAAKTKVVPNSKEQQEVNNKPTITSQHVHKNTTEDKKVNHSKPTTQAKPLHNNQQQKVAAASTKTNKTNTKTNKKTSKKTPTRKVKTPYNAVRQTRITKAKNVNYEMKRDVPARVETAIQSPDYRAFVTKSRLGYSKRLNDHNTKNTLCQVAKTQNTTLPSLVLEYYSSKNPPVTQEPEWSLKNALKNPTPWLKEPEKPKTYDKDSVIMDLKFIKEHIEAAKAIGYDIPKALYEYIPKQNASEEVVKQEIQVYEAVFGKGSSGLLLWF
ncbi:TPA: hypothetical protein CPT82_04535 [Candidatus Gastranaerophilales bacterium HUM_2]|nr:MAG TPA: hypothetical protein CPT82_04535 [Candidatus Gastranaerophilales bacterium HUM_2]